jgi:hypothetical protein
LFFGFFVCRRRGLMMDEDGGRPWKVFIATTISGKKMSYGLN